MEILAYVFVFCFGAIVGSFLNVVVLRHNTSLTLFGRSFCFSCGRQLTWKDLIPLVSFFALYGKCRFCRSKISWQYPTVEFLSALIFALVFWKSGGPHVFFSADPYTKFLFGEMLYIWFSFSVLLAILVYDVRHKIIPDGMAFLFAAISLAHLLLSAFFVPTAPWNMWDFLAGPLLAAPLAFLWLVSQGRWIGLGDAKLTLGIGWFLGFSAGANAVLLGFWTGAVFGVFLIVASKAPRLPFFRTAFTLKSEMPFAPFLILGLLLSFLGVHPLEALSSAGDSIAILLSSLNS